jgi:hypothetical protein
MYEDLWKQPTKDTLALLHSKYVDAFFESQGLKVEGFADLFRDEDGKEDPDEVLAFGLENAGSPNTRQFHRETGAPGRCNSSRASSGARVVGQLGWSQLMNPSDRQRAFRSRFLLGCSKNSTHANTSNPAMSNCLRNFVSMAPPFTLRTRRPPRAPRPRPLPRTCTHSDQCPFRRRASRGR